MACEGIPRNSFRSAVLGFEPVSPLVSDKHTRRVDAAGGLEQVPVPRTEHRRSNQRSIDREVRACETVTVRKGRRSSAVALVNLSGGGAMIEGDLDARLWDKVVLELGEHGEIECAVRWIRDQRFGLEFAHETRIDCSAALRDETLRQVIEENFSGEAQPVDDDPAAHPQRQQARHPLIWSGMIHHHHQSVVARIRNISAGGAMIQSTAVLSQDMEVVLDLGNAGTTDARVCWTRGDQAGLSFAQEFDVRRLASCKPEVASSNWSKPEYLRDENVDTSPWASQWSRLTLKELSRTLAG
ncbi:MAG: PilZ domain-containing protein [Pseudomonadota bacterium]|nr:PilZ domain-containing protein [Pseudomonadota bacterium]